jgi:O-antigen ligase
MAAGWLFYPLLLLVVLAPLPLGSNREWSWTLLAALSGALALLWSLAALLQPRQVSRSLSPVLMLLFLAVCGWAWWQAQTTTPAEWHHPLWSMAAGVLDVPLASEAGPGAAGPAMADSISLAADDTYTALLRLLAYGLVFFLSFQLCRDVRHARAVLRWMALAGLVASLYGLAVYWGRSGQFLWFWELEWRNSVRGTFVNRNSFATWLGLCLLCAVAWFYQHGSGRRNPAYALPMEREVRLEQWLVAIWKPLAMLIVMVAALVLTHSRGGFTAALAGGLVLLLAINFRQPIKHNRARLAMLAALAVVGASFWLTSEVLLKRLDVSNVDIDTRMEAYTLATDGIEDNPLLGFGYGTFADSFRLYRDESIGAHFDKAHNTYLENLFELGWPAALGLLACLAWLALICLRGLRQRGRDWLYPAVGLAATTLVAVHSLVDFSLQMPATAAAYALIMGAACAQSYPGRHS